MMFDEAHIEDTMRVITRALRAQDERERRAMDDRNHARGRRDGYQAVAIEVLRLMQLRGSPEHSAAHEVLNNLLAWLSRKIDDEHFVINASVDT
jgi:hypothetical protein